MSTLDMPEAFFFLTSERLLTVLVRQEAPQASSAALSGQRQTCLHVPELQANKSAVLLSIPSFFLLSDSNCYLPVLRGKLGMSPYAKETFGSSSIVSASPPSPEPHTIATFGFCKVEGSLDRMCEAVSVARA
jgi:hypothetical protein